MPVEGEIKFTPYRIGTPPGLVVLHYLAPDGSRWNVESIIGKYLQLYTIGYWGEVHPNSVSEAKFRAEWNEIV